MLDCKQVLAELSNYLDGEVSVDVKRAIEEHLSKCVRCTVIFDTSRRMLIIVSDAGPFQVPLDVSRRLHTRLAAIYSGAM